MSKVTNLADHKQWLRHRMEDDDGEIRYELWPMGEDPQENYDLDSDYVVIYGPNAKQTSFKMLDILNNRTRI